MEVKELRPELENCIKRVSKRAGITEYQIIEIQTNEKGEGYLGEIFLVKIRDKANEQRLSVVIKAAFKEDKIRDFIPIRMCYENEVYFYSTFWPVIRGIEKSSAINEWPAFVANCYDVCLHDESEFLVLENLRSAGFENFDKRSMLDDDHFRLIFKTYGRYHAYSFALRDQQPEVYEQVVDSLQDVYAEFLKGELFGKNLAALTTQIRTYLIPGQDDEIINQYDKYDPENIIDTFRKSLTTQCDYSVILHGDCWSNNLMFKYENSVNGKKPVEIRLLDWQLMKVGSPVCDLAYCLYSGTSKEIFDHLEEYLQIYHESLSEVLEELGSDPQKLFPFEALKEEWKKYSRFGLLMAINIWRMKTTDKDAILDLRDGVDIDDVNEGMLSAKYSEEDYSRRIRDILEHMNEIGAL